MRCKTTTDKQNHYNKTQGNKKIATKQPQRHQKRRTITTQIHKTTTKVLITTKKRCKTTTDAQNQMGNDNKEAENNYKEAKKWQKETHKCHTIVKIMALVKSIKMSMAVHYFKTQIAPIYRYYFILEYLGFGIAFGFNLLNNVNMLIL